MKLVLVAGAVALAGCSLVNPDYIAAEGHALAPASPGTGSIRSVAVLPPEGYRLYVDMDNGHSQTVDIDDARFMPGQRIEIAGDGRVMAF